MEAFRRFTPFDLTSEAQKASVAWPAFIRQLAPDIRKKSSEIKRCIMRGRQLCDLVKEAEKVCVCERERREAKERENRRDLRQERNLTRILATVIGEKEKDRLDRKPGQLKTEPQLKRLSCVRLKLLI